MDDITIEGSEQELIAEVGSIRMQEKYLSMYGVVRRTHQVISQSDPAAQEPTLLGPIDDESVQLDASED